jgi:anti-sigma regulatory factor (Ser/Thr protein kinase)
VGGPVGGFRHEALFYGGEDDFVARTLPFLTEGLARYEPILVVVGAAKIDRLRDALGTDARRVRFADMAAVGRNPARIIPAWAGFVSEHEATGRAFRGVGEPIWTGRNPDELVECERHEALLNLAFADGPAWRLACPYDTTTLPDLVLEEARRNHPYLRDGDGEQPSATYRDLAQIAAPFALPLPEPAGTTERMPFEAPTLSAVRAFVAERAARWGLPDERVQGLVLAVSEVATNTIRYAGASGTLRMWRTDASVICEIADEGAIADPLVGRRDPQRSTGGGFGLWLANQMCELVQVRTFPTGSVVRLHASLHGDDR